MRYGAAAVGDEVRAVRGAGGTVRLVMLPFEILGCVARESVGHALWETLRWFDRPAGRR
jgi:dipeptidyl aminopeptidase/acylaminoacyl peptidase